MSEDLFDRASELGLNVEFDENAKEFLTDKGFDPKYGARPLRRALQKYVEDPLAEALLNQNLGEGDTVVLTHTDGEEELEFEIEHGEPSGDGEAPSADASDESEEPSPEAPAAEEE